MDDGARMYRRFLNGDTAAIAEIVETYRVGLELYLLTIVGDAELAEELTQDTFVNIFIKKPHFTPKASFKTWLYTVGKNNALKFLKKQKRSVPLSYEDAVLIPDDARGVEEQYFADETRLHVHEVLNRLHPAYREILWLTYFEGLSNRESAAIFGKNVHSIESLVSRARKALKLKLQEEGFLYEDQ